MTINSNHSKIFIGCLTIFLAFLMLATRGNHWLSNLNLPSASVAIFFIAGFYCRRLKIFLGLYGLSVALDFYGAYQRNDFSGCLSIAYPMLLISYYILFEGGRYLRQVISSGYQSFMRQFVTVYAFLTLSVVISYTISSASYYFMSGHFSDPSLYEMIARLQKYMPSQLANAFLYVSIAFALHVSALIVLPKYIQRVAD